MAKKQKFYVVWVGETPGIYNSWEECQLQINGFPGAKYKSFTTMEEAKVAYQSSYDEYVGKDSVTKKPALSAVDKKKFGEPILMSLSVDGACSGNPGKAEYRGVFTDTGTELFREGPFEDGTNNVMEFLALVHVLAYCKKNRMPKMPIYSDSKIAINWVKRKRCATKLARTAKNGKLFELIQRAEFWLHNNSYENPILKWETKVWGEIPADFGRK